MKKLIILLWSTRFVWLWYIPNKFTFLVRNIKFDEYPKISGPLIVLGRGQINLGKGVSFNSGQRSNPIGGDSMLIIKSEKNAIISIGNHTGMSNCAIVCSSKISIGNHVKIGGGTKIYDTDFHHLNPKDRINEDTDIGQQKEIIIEDNVFIGAHSIILKGVIIGRNSILAAGSVLTKEIPDNEIWGGNPAKFIKKIN